jgi:hypothetical protein
MSQFSINTLGKVFLYKLWDVNILLISNVENRKFFGKVLIDLFTKLKCNFKTLTRISIYSNHMDPDHDPAGQKNTDHTDPDPDPMLVK